MPEPDDELVAEFVLHRLVLRRYPVSRARAAGDPRFVHDPVKEARRARELSIEVDSSFSAAVIARCEKLKKTVEAKLQQELPGQVTPDCDICLQTVPATVSCFVMKKR